MVAVVARLALRGGADRAIERARARCRSRPAPGSGGRACPCPTRAVDRAPSPRKSSSGAGARRLADRARRRRRARRPAPPSPGCGTRPPRTTRPCRARSARRASPDVLLAVEGRRLAGPAVVGGRQPLQRVVAQEDAERALELVAAAARHHVDRGGRRAALLGREAVRRHLELLDRVLRQVGERPAHHVVVVVLAVDRDVAAASELAGRRDRDHVRLGRVEVRRGRVARQQERELEEVAAVERQVLDDARPHHAPDEPVARGHAHARLSHLDRLGAALHVEHRVDAQPPPDLHQYVVDRLRVEAGGLEHDAGTRPARGS